MTEPPPSQDHPDDWARYGYDPAEPYYGPAAGPTRPGPGAATAGWPVPPDAAAQGPEDFATEAGQRAPGPALPTAPLWRASPHGAAARGAPAQGAPVQGAPAQPHGRQPGTGQEAARPGPQPGAFQPGTGQSGTPQPQPGAQQPGTPQPGAFQLGTPPPPVFAQDTLQLGRPSQAAAAPQVAQQGADAKGFLGALFDFSFTSFVTTRIIKGLYALIMVMTVLSALLFTIVMFRLSAGLGLLTLIIGDPLFIIIVMAFWRLVLESFMVVFRISEDVQALRRH
jgi:hypothetical protein